MDKILTFFQSSNLENSYSLFKIMWYQTRGPLQLKFDIVDILSWKNNILLASFELFSPFH